MKTQFNAFQMTVFLIVATSLTACPKPHSRKNSTQTQVVEMGDPLKVIEGARLDANVDFSFFKDVKKIRLTSVIEFVEKKSVTLGGKMTQKSLETENAPSTSEKENSFIEMDVVTTEGPNPSATLSTSILSLKISTGSVLGQVNGKAENLKLLHFSVSEDGQEMSWLLQNYDVDSGLNLSALYFSKRTEAAPRKSGNSRYQYVKGPGVLVSWPKSAPIGINAFGINAEGLHDKIVLAVADWNRALNGQALLNLKFDRAGYPPFSDLRKHGIYYIDSFRVNPRDDTGNYGLTVGITTNSDFVDSDILIFKSEFLKNYEGIIESDLRRTVVHEMGHFLGLDHQFDGTPSVMSYDFSDGGFVTDYDRAAIQELYK